MTESNGSRSTALVPVASSLDITPAEAQKKLQAVKQFQNVVHQTLIPKHDYGTIPGTPKPTLLKPGAEKIAKLLNLFDDYTILERVEDWESAFFHYLVKCTFSDIGSGCLVSSGLGSCNSKEGKYAYRWVGSERVPSGLDKASLEQRGGTKVMFEPDFALNKKETTGKYGKPATYWESFAKAINEKRAVRKKKRLGAKEYEGYELSVSDIEYRVPNRDIYDQVNTILKMAKKRALVDAALSVGRLSDLFTQDIEEFIGQVEEEPPVETPPDKMVEETADPGPPPAPEDKPAATAELAPVSEETLAEIAGLIAGSCKGGKRTTEQVLGQIKANIKAAFKRDLPTINDLTQDEAARVIEFLKKLK